MSLQKRQPPTPPTPPINALALQSQIFTLIQAQLIGINMVKRGCCCCTHVEQMPPSLGEAQTLHFHVADLAGCFANDLAFVQIIQTSQFAPCDLSTLVTERISLKRSDTPRPPHTLGWLPRVTCEGKRLVEFDNCGLKLHFEQNQSWATYELLHLLKYFHHFTTNILFINVYGWRWCRWFPMVISLVRLHNTLIGTFWIICSPPLIFMPSEMDIKTVFS